MLRFSSREWLTLTAVAALLLALLLQFSVAVWSGSMRLSLSPFNTADVDTNAILVAYCWRAEELTDSVTPDTYNFRPLKWDAGSAYIDLPTSGRSATWLAEDSYNHPKYLIILFHRGPKGSSPVQRGVKYAIQRTPRDSHSRGTRRQKLGSRP